MQIISINRRNAEHYTWGERCDGWHLVNDGQLSIVQELMPPGTTEVRHLHRHAQQFFFMLSGQAVMEVDGYEVQMTAGEGLRVLPGIPHQISNVSSLPAQFLVISQPASQGDRVLSDSGNNGH